MFLTFILESAGTQAGPADIGSPGIGISVFGTIHPDIFRFRVPLGSELPFNGLQLASLEPQDVLADSSASPCGNASLDERFAASRMAAADDCGASFDDRFRAAIALPGDGVRSAPEREVQIQRADAPKPSVSKAYVSVGPARKDAALPDDDGRIAIYDITAHTVYLPGGRRLEAHSGLGSMMDSPRHVHLRMRGATPPNIYKLALRERIFHGVRAIRLNPVDESKMYGRGGILAHTYMLGANGQSNGCVAFRNYPEFLDAYLKGEVTRLAVVDHLESPPGKLAAGQLPERVKELVKSTDRSRQYAAAGDR